MQLTKQDHINSENCLDQLGIYNRLPPKMNLEMIVTSGDFLGMVCAVKNINAFRLFSYQFFVCEFHPELDFLCM
jgi:hypothetical protein